MKFVVADYSAVEARVLSYLAGEDWRIRVFHEGRDIYCESASRMFGVPVEKHGRNSHLRQKGKIAELALGYGGRRLSYVKPRIEPNQYGGESVTYMGIDGTKHWSRIESFGPKFVENIVQAVSRDLLANAMKNLGYNRNVAHVHDELIIECKPETSLDVICRKMSEAPSWLPGLELRADGYDCGLYQKQ